jgi:hypothetical protein
MTRLADIRDIKRYAAEKMPGSVFTQIILQEPDEMTVSDFKAALPAWFTILKQENDNE